MNSQRIESIANAVLYEGYILYPYRHSSVKNQQRWNFGVLYPQAYSEAQKGSDACFMQTQCLIRTDEPDSADASIDIRIRFLHAISRKIGKLAGPTSESPGLRPDDLEIVDSIAIGDKVYQTWQETMERDVIVPRVCVADLLGAPVEHLFSFSSAVDLDPVKNDAGDIAAYIVRTRESIKGSVKLEVEKVHDTLFRLTVGISNLTTYVPAGTLDREEAILLSFLSTHTILGVTGGEFISLLDPPTEFRDFVAECKNIGTWPVLVGDEGSRDAMLSSPIILYDYPQIAPESAGDLFDGTEIDEILSLRIMTLSEDEKHEIRQSDDRAKQILERTENMPAEHFMKLHGVLRGMTAPNNVEEIRSQFDENAGRKEER